MRIDLGERLKRWSLRYTAKRVIRADVANTACLADSASLANDWQRQKHGLVNHCFVYALCTGRAAFVATAGQQQLLSLTEYMRGRFNLPVGSTNREFFGTECIEMEIDCEWNTCT